jgi:hypothetical protein
MTTSFVLQPHSVNSEKKGFALQLETLDCY